MKPLTWDQVSFEFFPPKTAEGKQQLLITASVLAKSKPAFFSVTFGAGGATRDGTLETVLSVHDKTQITVAPHLSCMGFIRKELITLIQHYQSLGVKRIVALRGDMPSGMVSVGDFKFAHELVALIREVAGNHFVIEVAAYPECHPQAKNALTDMLNLKKKQDAGANGAITQYFYNADAYFYLLDACCKQHIDLPIVPGIMPIMHFTKLVRFSDVCGAEIPRWLYKKLESYGDDQASIRAFGVEFVSEFCQRLLAGGAPGLHFYTLNQAEICLQIMRNLTAQKIAIEAVA